jgi:undecaprenyl-diphosphatase
MLVGLLRLATGRLDEGGRLAGLIVVGTLPVVAAGFLARDWIAANLHGVAVVAWANIVFACLLWAADRYGLLLRRVQHMRLVEALVVGLAQVLALVPGTSRAGVTMTVARLLGYEREEAARFSLLLAIPAIAGAGLLIGVDLYQREALQLGREALLAAGISMLTALAALFLMMRWLRHASFQPFVLYRLALGALLLWLVYA